MRIAPRVFIRKVRNFFRARPLHLRKDWRNTWFATRRFLNRNRWPCLFSLFAVLFFSITVVNPHDREWLDFLRGAGKGWNQPRQDLAREISHWGDFAQFNLILSASIWLFGYLRSARWIQRLAFATLFAATLAGVTCNIFRLTMGRPRPYTEYEDRFYGMPGTVRGWDYQSFPSGHTSTAFGSGIPIVAAAGPWAAPVLVASGSVAWARMYKNKHYPTDVIVGGYLGILFGMAGSWRLRKVRLRIRQRRKQRKAALQPRRVSAPQRIVPARRREPLVFRA